MYHPAKMPIAVAATEEDLEAAVTPPWTKDKDDGYKA